MKTRDSIHKDILGKQGDETNAKYREVTLKDTPTSSNNIKESQQTLFLREDENKQTRNRFKSKVAYTVS